jgi:hypothetical protein
MQVTWHRAETDKKETDKEGGFFIFVAVDAACRLARFVVACIVCISARSNVVSLLVASFSQKNRKICRNSYNFLKEGQMKMSFSRQGLLGLVALTCVSALEITPMCDNSTSVALSVTWDAPQARDGLDMFYVALSSAGKSTKPFMIRTTATNSITLIDLVPSKIYWVQVHAHPGNESIVWGWGAYSTLVSCSTKPTRPNTPHSLTRFGNLSQDTISLVWSVPSLPDYSVAYEVGYMALPLTATESESESLHRNLFVPHSQLCAHPAMVWRRAGTPDNCSSSLVGLAPGTSYLVAVRAVVTDGTASPNRTVGSVSDLVLFKTAAPGVMYTEV